MAKATASPRLTRVVNIVAKELGVAPRKVRNGQSLRNLGLTPQLVATILNAVTVDFDFNDSYIRGRTFETVHGVMDILDDMVGPEFATNGFLKLTEDQFINRYKPELTEEGNYYRQREWFEKNDTSVIHNAILENRCWTAVDDDDGEFCIVWGNRTVNRLYNIITARPIEDQDWEVQASDPREPRDDEDEEE